MMTLIDLIYPEGGTDQEIPLYPPLSPFAKGGN